MSNHEEHHHESPKRVYFGIPFGFALAFWFIIFLSLKACDGGAKKDCCKESGECTKECKAKCEAEGKTDCTHQEGNTVKEEKTETTAPAAEEKKEGAVEEKMEKTVEEKPAATEEKK